MINIDKKITADTMNLLKKLVGSEFISFKAENFHFDNTVFGQVEITTGQLTVFVNATLQAIDYFGAMDDICILDISTNPSITDERYFEGLTITPIHRKIREIHLVQEQQKLFENSHQIYNIEITRGIIFVMEDDYEVSFEKTSPFTELIAISRGRNLIDDYIPVEDIMDGCASEYTMSISRSIDIIRC